MRHNSIGKLFLANERHSNFIPIVDEKEKNASKKYLILLSVRIRIHCGMEQFCLSFLPNLRLILNVLWAACK